MNILFGNYGDGTIALIQWAHENKVQNVTVCHMETGFAAADESWQQRVQQGIALAQAYGFSTQTLKSVMTWSELALKRREFSSAQSPTCAGWLKGLAFLEWLDEVDSACQATIVLPKHVTEDRGDVVLQEWEKHSPHFGERRVWQPLYDLVDDHFYDLIRRGGFKPLYHRSLECAPCVHSKPADLSRLNEVDQKKVAELEDALARPLFAPSAHGGAQGIRAVVEWARNQPQDKDKAQYSLGCGTPFACGD